MQVKTQTTRQQFAEDGFLVAHGALPDSLPRYRELNARERAGYDALQAALDRSARSPLLVRSRHPETLADSPSWKAPARACSKSPPAAAPADGCR